MDSFAINTTTPTIIIIWGNTVTYSFQPSK